MDVILARLDPRQLRVYCSDALQQELAKTLELLEQALAASKRAEEVQHASRKLDVQEFHDDSALLHRLEQIDSLRLQLSISIDHIARCARGQLPPGFVQSVKNEASATNGLHSILALSDASVIPVDAASDTADVIDLSALDGDSEPSPIAAPSSSRKRKLSVSSSVEQQQSQPQPPQTAATPTAAKKFVPAFQYIPISSRLGKSIQAAFECAVDVTKRKASDRVQGYTTLAAKTSIVVKHLESADASSGLREAMDALAFLVTTAVSVLVKAKQPIVKRLVATKKLKMIQDIQSKYPAYAALFDRSLASLSKYMDLAFPLSAKETEELKRRVRAAIKDVKAWESGTYSVPDFQEKMRFTKLVLDSNCESWTPKRDAAVQELLDLLIARLRGFKDSHAQGKRKETLLAWRKEVKAPKARTKDKKDVSTEGSGVESGASASSRITAKAASSVPVEAPVESAPDGGSSSSRPPPATAPSASASAPAPLQPPSTSAPSTVAATSATSASAPASAMPIQQASKRVAIQAKKKSKKGKRKKSKKVVVAPIKAKKA